MWKIMMLLWSVPIALGIVMLARLVEGSPPVSDKEWQLFFGDRKEMTWSPWLAVEFVALAVVFFIIGLFEGLVLVNLGSLSLAAAALITGLAAMLLVAGCLRFKSRKNQIASRDSAPYRARDNHSADLFSR